MPALCTREREAVATASGRASLPPAGLPGPSRQAAAAALALANAAGAAATEFRPPVEVLDLLLDNGGHGGGGACPRAPDLLLVDEAAALPLAVLQRLLGGARRCVAFATTVHGYEGSGRGFAVRFQGFLRRHASAVHALRLSQPVRWGPGDPLQAWTARVLLLDMAPPDGGPPPGGSGGGSVRVLPPSALARDERLLRQVFGLLVLAHYQTTPADLLRLLDAPNLEVLGPWRATAPLQMCCLNALNCAVLALRCPALGCPVLCPAATRGTARGGVRASCRSLRLFAASVSSPSALSA